MSAYAHVLYWSLILSKQVLQQLCVCWNDACRKVFYYMCVKELQLLCGYYGLPIVYGRPYCNDAKEGVGAITPPKLNRGWWNSATTKYFEGNVVCKNLGAIGSGAAEGRRKTSLRYPKKLDFFFCRHNHARSHPLPVGRFSRNFR